MGTVYDKDGNLRGTLSAGVLPRIVQVLFQDRKTGKLNIVSGGQEGYVAFVAGMIFDSRFGDIEKEQAFYDMLTLEDGTYDFDPTWTEPDPPPDIPDEIA